MEIVDLFVVLKVNKYKVIVIGAGPAGIAAAIQLKRQDIEPLLLEQNGVGGLLRNANLVENYPGFPNGITGVELVATFKEQLEVAGIQACHETAVEVNYSDDRFVTRTDQREIESDYAVIATGTIPKSIPDLSITEEVKHLVYYEVFPLLGERDKKIAIIGAGDAAFDYAINLAQNNQVLILNRGVDVRCLPLLYERAQHADNIEYITEISVQNIAVRNDSLILTCSRNDDIINIGCDRLLIAIGRNPNLGILSKHVETNGLAKKNKKLFLIGDVVNDRFRQTAICVGDGVRAAMEIAYDMQRKTI